MPIPTEPVGSLPRPAKLQAAYADYDAGKITKEQLTREQDAACLDSIKRMEATGAPIVSDGEQRMSSFATYPLTDTLAGTSLADHLAGDCSIPLTARSRATRGNNSSAISATNAKRTFAGPSRPARPAFRSTSRRDGLRAGTIRGIRGPDARCLRASSTSTTG